MDTVSKPNDAIDSIVQHEEEANKHLSQSDNQQKDKCTSESLATDAYLFFQDLLLSAERRQPMSTRYDDVSAVAQILEEKEKDLELAAKIGQSLLEQNRDLQARTEFLEEQLIASNDAVVQLRHELQMKMNLLHVYADSDDLDSCELSTTPTRAERRANVELLQQRMQALEQENSNLKTEVAHLKKLTFGLEVKEQQLITDCVRQLEASNERIEVLYSKIAEKTDECSAKDGEVLRLNRELFIKQNKEQLLLLDNEELNMQVTAAVQSQTELTTEIADLQERYTEVVAMLHEAQEELRIFRRRPTPHRAVSPDSQYDSLASELEASDSGFYNTPLVSARSDGECKNNDQQHHTTKAFRLLQSAFDRAAIGSRRQYDTIVEDPASVDQSPIKPIATLSLDAPSTPSLSDERDSSTTSSISGCYALIGSSRASPIAPPQPPPPLSYSPLSLHTDDFSPRSSDGHRALSKTSSTDSLENYQGPAMGEPGMPGTRDLDYSIRRLMSVRFENSYQRNRREKGLPPTASLDRSNRRSPPAPTAPSTTTSHEPTIAIDHSSILSHWRRLATPTTLFGATIVDNTIGITNRPVNTPDVSLLLNNSLIQQITRRHHQRSTVSSDDMVGLHNLSMLLPTGTTTQVGGVVSRATIINNSH